MLMSAPATNVEPGADEHDGVRARVRDGLRHGFVDRLPHALGQRVHRRVVDGQDGDTILHAGSERKLIQSLVLEPMTVSTAMHVVVPCAWILPVLSTMRASAVATASAGVEHGGLAAKSPDLAPSEAACS